MEKVKELTVDLIKLGCKVTSCEPMRYHTTFRIGGNADLFVIPKDRFAFVKTVNFLEDVGIPYVILGNGSNVLFDDDGYDGVVISTQALKGLRIEGNRVEAEAGVKINELAVTALENSLSGMERLFGIPGTIGGAVNMNAGSFGLEIGELVESVTVLFEGRVFTIGRENLEFSYRRSNISENRMKIISVNFKLVEGDRLKIKYEMNRWMNLRVENQPIDFPSAGSFFKRPKPDVPVGRIIDEAGLRGYRVGNAMVSKKHAAFIVNLGSASSRDVLKLAEIVREKVKFLKGF
ncbi:MAG: UDP-N-acetylmuramate dehydrogenase, partial [Thermotogae bacterium]|nr:UDP-N-acetylmuramate dehydrogenase [Thermotogota bacterium]